ncbi:MAG: hypothetical protein ABH836_01840 [Candidatus Omnitrophota bacterium]
MEMRKNLEIAKSSWKLTFKTLREYPRISVPFVFSALAEVFFLIILYYAPRYPFSAILAPPIKTFVGEAYLHYPLNFILLPRLFYFAKVFVWFTMGICAWAVSSNMVSQVQEGRFLPSIAGSFNRVIRRYPALFLFALSIFILSLVIFKLPQFLVMKLYFLPRGKYFTLQSFSFISFFITIAVEALLIYIVPSIIIERQSFFGALKRTWALSKEIYMPTLAIILIPRLLEMGVFFLKQKLPLIMTKTFPEITLWVLGADIVVSFLTNLIVITLITDLFLIKQGVEKEI